MSISTISRSKRSALLKVTRDTFDLDALARLVAEHLGGGVARVTIVIVQPAPDREATYVYTEIPD